MVDTPLLDTKTLQQLQNSAKNSRFPIYQLNRQSAHKLIGEQISFYRGRGLEFDENRAYQAGDEPRMINWRLYARTGELFTKVFSEERRPEVYILADRRARMRFGSRRQLKVEQAAKISAYCFYQAQQQAMPVGGIVINETSVWCPPSANRSTGNDFLNELIAPCPPLAFDASQPKINESLHLLAEKVPTGSVLILISDFTDLDTNHSIALLNQLALRHSVTAMHIQDPVERELPATTDMQIDDPGREEPIRIDGRDAEKLSMYTRSIQQRNSELSTTFQQCGIPFSHCSTEVDSVSCIEAIHVNQRID